MSRVAVHENDNNNDAHHHNPQIQLNNAAAANPHQIIHQPPPPPAAAVGISTTAAPPAGPCPTAAPTTADADNKRFTTSYGMVVWPALPGLSGAATTAINSTASTTTRTIPDLPLPEAAARAMASVQNVHEAAAIPRAMAAAASGPSSHSSEPLYVTASYNPTLLRASCNACHRMKRKCDGKQPCARCARRKRECFYSYKQKSGPPKGSKRKLIEAEDDLPENRSNKHPLGGAPLPLAAPAPAPPWSGGIKDATTTWSEGNIAETTITNNTDEAQSCAQPGSAPSEPLPLPLPAPSPEARAAAAAAVAASRMNALAPVPPALAAAGLHRSYMLQAPAVLPGLSGLQTPSVLPGLTGGGGGSGVGGAGGGGPAPTTTPLVTHPQYGTVYQHQYPPEVYALYLAELRQRSCGNNIGGGGGGGGGDGGSTGSPSTSTASTSISGCTSTNTNTNTSTSNISNNQGGSAGGGGGVGGSCGVDGDVGGGGGGGHVASMPEGPTTTVPASFLSNLYEGRQGWASEASSAVSSDPTARVTSAEASTNVGPASKQSSTGGIGRMSQPIIFGESSLEAGQGASGCWGSNSGGGVADGSGRGGGGGGGDNGGCAPNGVELTHVAKGVGVGDGGADGDGGGYVYEPAKAAAAAAAASAALAAAVAAAIAESSSGPNDNGNDIQNVNHNDKLSETTLPSWDGGSGSAWPSLPGIGVGLRDPVSPVKKGNPLEAESEAAAAVAAEPKSRGATTTMGVTDGVDELFYGSSGSRATTPRERQAAAGLLLYGARGGQAGGGGEHGVAKEKDERFQRKGSSAVAKFG